MQTSGADHIISYNINIRHHFSFKELYQLCGFKYIVLEQSECQRN